MSNVPRQDLPRKLNPWQQSTLAPCGTESAYRRHLRYSEQPDEDCLRAHREGEARRAAARRQRRGKISEARREVARLRQELARAERWLAAELAAAAEQQDSSSTQAALSAATVTTSAEVTA